eukprot:CAMPEP_0116578240 /NCGR_PEP_ID=MMETSP0397-20121206/21590_1 /TAXON_ID=216820 /ORGANISM="Cyclophora tenuis, Strain ECT3854" /LENGTH=344 /DNA_ID=CAMNT_0004107595 /DNA_START=720 /DNA_END=1755 /DNA_ORIENTATION=+
MKLSLLITAIAAYRCSLGRTVAALQTPLPKSKSTYVRPKNVPPDTGPGMQQVLQNIRKTKNPTMPLWNMLTQKAKDDVKAWFVERGDKKGVPFAALIDYFRSHQSVVEEHFQDLWNVDLEYPNYYTKTFHGYETGNLSFEAAEDCLPATLSISLTYWPDTSPIVTADWMRFNFTNAIQDYRARHSLNDSPRTILDVAGSVGVSTKALLETNDSYIYHPDAAQRVTYHHELAEDTPFPDNTMDIVSMSFLVHELPTKVAQKVLNEALRILKPGGVLAVLDLQPKALQRLPPIRRFLFGVTEPHIQDYCANTNLVRMMTNAGYAAVEQTCNDPMNLRTVGMKPLSQ